MDRNPPARLTVTKLIEARAKKVSTLSFSVLSSKLAELYKKDYGFNFVMFKSQSQKTAMLRIVALCEINGWDPSDYIQIVYHRFREKFHKRLVPTNALGLNNQLYYADWLRDNGYVKEKDGIRAPDPQARIQDLKYEAHKRSQISDKKLAGQLPEQIKIKAEAHAKEYAENLKQKIIAGKHKPKIVRKVRYLLDHGVSLTNKQKLQYYLEYIRAQAKEEFLKKWREERA